MGCTHLCTATSFPGFKDNLFNKAPGGEAKVLLSSFPVPHRGDEWQVIHVGTSGQIGPPSMSKALGEKTLV